MGLTLESLQHLKVRDLISSPSATWNLERIDQVLPHYKHIITSLKPSILGAKNKRIWLKNPYGEYTAKLGYLVASKESKIQTLPNPIIHVDWNCQVWKLKVSPKIKLFLWKAINKALLVGEQLIVRNNMTNSQCCRCNGSESILHLLFLRPYAQEVWRNQA